MSTGSARFGRDRRIRKSSHFGSILKAGARGAGALVSAAIVPAPGNGRIGISAPVKIGDSVHRNRARRLVREHYRKSSMRAVPYDIVFNLKPGFAELSAAEAGTVLDDALSKAIAAGKRGGRRPHPVH
jgi:ribonuclease P protein component